MKRFFVLFAMLFFCVVPAVMADDPDEELASDVQVSDKPRKFSTKEACLAALESGNYAVYQPSDFSNAGPLQPGEVEVRPEAPTCYDMKVVRDKEIAVNGRAWIVQDHSVTLLYKDGKPLRRKDCRNQIFGQATLPPKPGKVRFHKETFNPDSLMVPVPTGIFFLYVGDYKAQLDSNGDAEIEVPPGTYEVKEEINSSVWEQWDISATRVTVESGKTVNVIVKNRQRRPEPTPVAVTPSPPPPSEHFCPACEEAKVASEFFQTEKGRFTERLFVSWEGMYKISWWMDRDQLVSSPELILTEENLGKSGEYQLNFEGTGSQGHGIICPYNLKIDYQGRSWIRSVPCLNIFEGPKKGLWWEIPLCAAIVYGVYELATMEDEVVISVVKEMNKPPIPVPSIP